MLIIKVDCNDWNNNWKIRKIDWKNNWKIRKVRRQILLAAEDLNMAVVDEQAVAGWVNPTEMTTTTGMPVNTARQRSYSCLSWVRVMGLYADYRQLCRIISVS